MRVVDAYNKSYSTSSQLNALLTSVMRNATAKNERMALFDTDGALENVLFEVEVKTING